MTWSTRELAELAGTTVNTVRHYHRLGLLAEPPRLYNGYKQYTVQELVQLLRLRRLVELGVPLSRIKHICSGDESTRDALRDVDAEIRTKIERLHKARAEIATVLRENAPPDSPAGFASVASRLSESDNSIIHIYTQLFDEDAMADVRRMVEVDSDQGVLGEEINALSPDADEATRRRLAQCLAPKLAQNLIDYPWLQEAARRMSKNRYVARRTFTEAMTALYNSAQLDVFSRAGAIAQENLRARRSQAGTELSELGVA